MNTQKKDQEMSKTKTKTTIPMPIKIITDSSINTFSYTLGVQSCQCNIFLTRDFQAVSTVGEL